MEQEKNKPWAFSRRVFCDGMRDGFPIALGYFAVAFSLGIAERHAGFTPMQGFWASLLNNASAGEYCRLYADCGQGHLTGRWRSSR